MCGGSGVAEAGAGSARGRASWAVAGSLCRTPAPAVPAGGAPPPPPPPAGAPPPPPAPRRTGRGRRPRVRRTGSGHRPRLRPRLRRGVQGAYPCRLVRDRRRDRLREPAAAGQARRALQRQFRRDRPRARPVRRVLGQAPRDQPAQRVRYGAQFGRGVRDPLGRAVGGAVRERGRPGRRVRQQQPQHEQVRRGARRLAPDLLGGEVAQPYRELAALPRLGPGGTAERPERREPGPVLGQQHRPRREPLEHRPGGVHPGQRLGQARAQYPYGPLGQRAGERDGLGERQRGYVRRRRPQTVVLRPGERRLHPAAGQPFGGAGLGLEAAAERGQRGQFRPGGGHHDPAVPVHVPGEIPHRARGLTEAGQDRVRTEAAWIVLTQRLHGAPPL